MIYSVTPPCATLLPASLKSYRKAGGIGLQANPLSLAIFILLLIMLGLSGCRTSPRTPTPEPEAATVAEQYFRSGNYARAAQDWQQQALEVGPQEASDYRVRAADAWLLAGQPESAKDLLKWISRNDLDPGARSRLDLVLADLALRQERPDEAALHLQHAQSDLPRTSRGRYDNLSSRLGQLQQIPALKDISRAATLSDSMSGYNPGSALALLESLEYVPSGELAVRADNPRAERRLTGWLDLTLTIRQNLVESEHVAQSIAAWKIRNSYHPLTESEALDLWLRYRQQFTPPRRVAVLLPDSGRLSSAGAAIRDGLMGAFIENPGGAEIQFFGTGDQPDSAISAYFNALDAGVDWIIGPLDKDAIEALMGLAGLSTPVLALNELPTAFQAPAGLQGRIFGISLSQEQEAIAVARHALRADYQRAVVLAPDSAWGDRMAAAFEEEFFRGNLLQENRQIIAAARFVQADNDYSPVIERILKIDESKARKRSLENTLQMPVEFEAVRRSDIDFIFLAANAAQAGQLRPQLRFHDAGDIPVYSTGRIYTGRPDPAHNQDLNGIRFPITPWQLENTKTSDLPELESLRGGNLAALYSVGQDAWNVLPWIELMKRDPDFIFPGKSGHYHSGHNDLLVRDPAWAIFSRGRPAPLAPPEEAGSLSSLPE